MSNIKPDAKIALAVLAIAAAGALPTSASAQCVETHRILSEVKESGTVQALQEKLGKPAKEAKEDKSMITTWTDEHGSTLRVVSDSAGRVQTWSHRGPNYAIVNGALAVLSCGAK